MDLDLDTSKGKATLSGIDVPKVEQLLNQIEQELGRVFSLKYKSILYLALTSEYDAEELASSFRHSKSNINADFNRYLGTYIKEHLGLSKRLGITSIRRVFISKGYRLPDKNSSEQILKSRYYDSLERYSDVQDDEHFF